MRTKLPKKAEKMAQWQISIENKLDASASTPDDAAEEPEDEDGEE